MQTRIILHIDMDYFFAQIEERENPQFRGKPIIVGADPKKGRGRGVVSTSNYIARKYGIKSAMPISDAWRRCPKAIFLPVNMELYKKVSEKIMEIIRKYSPIWEIVSLDEAYLDLTSYSQILKNLRKLPKKEAIKKSYQKVEILAKKIKKEIFKKEELTATVGIGPNKLIAKMAAEAAKPNGLLIITPSKVQKFLNPLNCQALPGIGPKTAEKLKNIGIEKIRELKKISKKKLQEMFGIVGKTIYERARGIDETPVTQEKIIKSLGKEHTFEKDTRDPELIFKTFNKIIKKVHKSLLKNNFSFRTITVICRFSDFETHTKSKTFKKKTKDLKTLKSTAKKLLLKFIIENLKPIRLIGVRVS